LIGKTISHYKIQEKIGEGGMGVVYKAEDTKLKRTVALKFLPPELTRNQQAKERFTHEAQASAALDHPNICTVHEIDEVEGKTFISMAYLKGQSLKDKIALGPLEIQEAINVATQAAEGINEAHEKGIVHRDIKPANIMLTDKGQAKIMDFGLAKLAWGMDLTKTATIMGTVAYMSPEQAKGEKVDHRTDIWSLGCVLYEMLSGEKPFKSTHEQAAIYAILHEEPKLLTSFRPDIPKSIEKSVMKAMEKDPSRRYQNIQEFIQELTSISSTTREISEEKSIVVLPFKDISPGKDNEYFCDGMTEEIITDLSHIHDLLVISRSSAMTFKGTKSTIKEIADKVNVRYVLEGSVRKAGNEIRITAQLVDVKSDAHLWAEKYSGTLDNVFDIQEKVSRSIVNALKLKLSPEEKEKIKERPIDNVQIYKYYLKANAEIFKFTEDATDRAILYLQHALDIIGDNALIYSGMALAYWNLVNIGVKQEEYLAKAEECIKKDLAMDPEFPKAHAVLGWINHLGNPQKSVYHLKRALAVSPDDPFVLLGLVAPYGYVGKISEAVPLCEKVIKIDPLDFITNVGPGWLCFYDGQYEPAFQEWRRLYEMYPENPYSQFWYSLILAYNKEIDKALSIIDQNAKANPDNVIAKLGLILKYGILKDKDRAFQEMTPDFRKTCQRDPTFSHHLAGIFALLETKEEALDWLESAVNSGFINYPLLAEKDPWLENIRGEERFKKLMERVKYEWENFEV